MKLIILILLYILIGFAIYRLCIKALGTMVLGIPKALLYALAVIWPLFLIIFIIVYFSRNDKNTKRG